MSHDPMVAWSVQVARAAMREAGIAKPPPRWACEAAADALGEHLAAIFERARRPTHAQTRRLYLDVRDAVLRAQPRPGEEGAAFDAETGELLTDAEIAERRREQRARES